MEGCRSAGTVCAVIDSTPSSTLKGLSDCVGPYSASMYQLSWLSIVEPFSAPHQTLESQVPPSPSASAPHSSATAQVTHPTSTPPPHSPAPTPPTPPPPP